MSRAKKWNNRLWGVLDHKNLKDLDLMRETVQSFMDAVVEDGYSIRVRTYQKNSFYCEVVKNYETVSYVKIDSAGRLFKGKYNKKHFFIDDYIQAGKWESCGIGDYY